MDSSLNDKIFLQLIFSYKNDTLTVCFGKEDSFIRKKTRAKLAAVASGDIGISYCNEITKEDIKDNDMYLFFNQQIT